jgi:phosphatidylglycerophosphate synthase
VRLSIPNLITLGRIILVPIVVWAITSGEMRAAFFLFVAAGISDAVDGFLGQRAWRSDRSAGRQGADRLDLRRA